ncbi:MAG: hypothetical protein ACK502_05005 [Alphaproteobacteria bacterium]
MKILKLLVIAGAIILIPVYVYLVASGKYSQRIKHISGEKKVEEIMDLPVEKRTLAAEEYLKGSFSSSKIENELIAAQMYIVYRHKSTELMQNKCKMVNSDISYYIKKFNEYNNRYETKSKTILSAHSISEQAVQQKSIDGAVAALNDEIDVTLKNENITLQELCFSINQMADEVASDSTFDKVLPNAAEILEQYQTKISN